jgi:hypothetical protein
MRSPSAAMRGSLPMNSAVCRRRQETAQGEALCKCRLKARAPGGRCSCCWTRTPANGLRNARQVAVLIMRSGIKSAPRDASPAAYHEANRLLWPGVCVCGVSLEDGVLPPPVAQH